MNCYDIPCTNPWWNMAFDEWLLQCGPEEPVFRLWRNEPSVIIGYNQVAAQEVNLEYLKQHGIKLARRVTGGGAVYHDLQNLNYTFAGPIACFGAPDAPASSSDPDRESVPPSGAGLFASALRTLGVPAEVSGRNDIFVEGRKISGYARSVWHNREIVHGTLMYNVDIDTLTAALNVEGSSKLNLKGVTSVRSRVTNVRDYLPQFASLDELQAALHEILSAQSYPPSAQGCPPSAQGCPPSAQGCPPANSNDPKAAELSLSPAEQAAVDSLAETKFASPAWIYKL